MSSSNLWLSNSTHRIFGWKELLEEWDATLQIPPQVTRCLDNLQAATDPNGVHDPHLSQFLTYLNYEQEGIVWFLYECIALRWMYGRVHIEYIRNLVDEVENLDGYFPNFPGFPLGKTVRQFVEENLDEDELEAVQMMPPLVPVPVRTPVRTARADFSYAQRTPLRRVNAFNEPMRHTSAFHDPLSYSPVMNVPKVRRTVSKKVEPVVPIKAEIEMRFIRSDSSSDDDVLRISQVSADCYNILYRDKQSNVKNAMISVSRQAVVSFLSITLRLLTIDEEPFKSVQVTLPSMPAIILSPQNLSSQTRDLIYDSVELTMDNWPLIA